MRSAILLLALLSSCAARDNTPPTAKASNGKIAITAMLFNDEESIARELGAKLDKGFIVVRVTLEPKGDEPIAVFRDDFILHSFNDGQQCSPFYPSQIAGNAQLVITSGPSGALAAQDNGTIWGPGPGGSGPPLRLPGDSGGIAGTPTAGTAPARASIETAGKGRQDETLAVLEKKILPEKEIKEPVSGLLYFLLEGKHKPKQLALDYKGAGGRLLLEFKGK